MGETLKTPNILTIGFFAAPRRGPLVSCHFGPEGGGGGGPPGLDGLTLDNVSSLPPGWGGGGGWSTRPERSRAG